MLMRCVPGGPFLGGGTEQFTTGEWPLCTTSRPHYFLRVSPQNYFADAKPGRPRASSKSARGHSIPIGPSFIPLYPYTPTTLFSIMAPISSHAALNKVGSGSMTELKDYITRRLACPSTSADVRTGMPVGLHFVILEKLFKGTNQPFISCPIQFLLGDQTSQSLLCQPVWTEPSLRSKVNRKAKVGVQKLSVIRLDDYSVVAHKNAPLGYLLFIRSYIVVKKDVDEEAYNRWSLE